ncbi:hypothetical protein VTJ83DRAFT_4342 [Remersonia thermophila]|uniref:C2H2-type domain-containing protein n=1 Tax=Remersonia thermophila TaxID=72144 RepID=A0ABR4D9R6_9PEZI
MDQMAKGLVDETRADPPGTPPHPQQQQQQQQKKQPVDAERLQNEHSEHTANHGQQQQQQQQQQYVDSEEKQRQLVSLARLVSSAHQYRQPEAHGPQNLVSPQTATLPQAAPPANLPAPAANPVLASVAPAPSVASPAPQATAHPLPAPAQSQPQLHPQPQGAPAPSHASYYQPHLPAVSSSGSQQASVQAHVQAQEQAQEQAPEQAQPPQHPPHAQFQYHRHSLPQVLTPSTASPTPVTPLQHAPQNQSHSQGPGAGASYPHHPFSQYLEQNPPAHPLQPSLPTPPPPLFAPRPRGRPPRLPLANKPVIMDPPAARRAGQPQRPATVPGGFPSPMRDHASSNPKFVDDTARIRFAIQQSLPEAVRRIIRDNWEKCLLGSEFHQAFILNASIHHAQPHVMKRAVRDFGGKVVAEAKQELVAHVTTEILDDIADFLIEKASDRFLDKCMEKRLLTIEAKPLINMLARAKRLGYEPTDIIQDGQEHVIPQAIPPTTTMATTTVQPSANTDGPRLQCLDCYRTFVFEDAFNYHKNRRVCVVDPPTAEGFAYACLDCGEGFIRVEDRERHVNNRLCGTHGRPPRPRSGPGRPPKTAQPFKDSTATPPPARPRLQTPGIPGFQLSLQSTPASGKKYIGSPNDPYAHLTPEMREQMEQELRDAELKYAPRFQEAQQIPDEEQRRQKLDGLRNSFGTKQSMIRKKYGVRLRERRTKAEIIAEKERMGLAALEKARELEQLRAENDAAGRASREASKGGSGWTAANTPREDHGAKRQRLDQSGAYYKSPYTSANDTPTRKQPPSASQPVRVYEQSGARVEVHEPVRPATSRSATPTGSDRGANGGRPSASAPQPVVIDDSSDDDDDEDIPSTLPSHVRKSLASSSSKNSPLHKNP